MVMIFTKYLYVILILSLWLWCSASCGAIYSRQHQKNPLALQLMAQGLYNHSTVPLTQEEEELQEMQAAGNA